MMLLASASTLVVIGQKVVLPDAVLNGVEPLARLVGGRAVGQVAARIEAHAQDRVTGFETAL
jgi:hypothetical protein